MSTADDVTCFVLKRRLMLCRTNCGALLVFSADTQVSDSASKHSKIDFESKPLKKIKISKEPIVIVKVEHSIIKLTVKISRTSTLSLNCVSKCNML